MTIIFSEQPKGSQSPNFEPNSCYYISIAFTHRLYLLSFANLIYHVGKEGRAGALLDRSLGFKHQAELVRKIEHCCLVAEKLTVVRPFVFIFF